VYIPTSSEHMHNYSRVWFVNVFRLQFRGRLFKVENYRALCTGNEKLRGGIQVHKNIQRKATVA
jgi:hypothetical protein